MDGRLWTALTLVIDVETSVCVRVNPELRMKHTLKIETRIRSNVLDLCRDSVVPNKTHITSRVESTLVPSPIRSPNTVLREQIYSYAEMEFCLLPPANSLTQSDLVSVQRPSTGFG